MPRVFVFLILLIIARSELPPCKPVDYHNEYTECDSAGGRWRVSVPKPDTCVPSIPPKPPTRGKSCDFRCKAGQFLDIDGEQDCKQCPPGTYSLGGGMRFDEWNSIPSGFHVETSNLDNPLHSSHIHSNTNCSLSEWKPHGEFIASVPGPCSADLVYSVMLVEPGLVAFEYQHSSSSAFFQLKVQNSQCQSSDVGHDSDLLSPTEEGEYKPFTVKLTTGLNVLTWKSLAFSSHLSRTPIMIRLIEISGVAYSSECTRCKNGTYSNGTAASCTPCPRNTFSGRGSVQCDPCDPHTEYAKQGSAKCSKRPLCTTSDYFAEQAPCDQSTKKTYKEFKWIEPKICISDVQGAAQLPPKGESEDCAACNPGQELVNGKCQFCASGSFSDGSGLCKPCPTSTAPNYVIEYQWWDGMPVNMTSDCITFNEFDCGGESRWLPEGDQIHTHFGYGDEAYLVLSLVVPGFREGGDLIHAGGVGTITFNFETICSGKCEFVFLTNETGRSEVVNSWTGTTGRSGFRYIVKTNKCLSFTWAFMQSEWQISKRDFVPSNKDKGIIYSIKIENPSVGGTVSCQDCPKGISKEGCVPCPDGHYISNDTTCQPCPTNSVINSGNLWGKENCKECGPGLKAKGGKSCVTDCRFTDDSGQVFSFEGLKKPKFVQGAKMFTGTGAGYLHGFNFSLCSTEPEDSAMCVSNTSFKVFRNDEISSIVCRTTMVPSQDGKKVMLTQPISVGDYVTKIVRNISLAEQYAQEGFDDKGILDDIHVYLASNKATAACSAGRTTIITLRCDLREEGSGTIEVPPRCLDGTCDGCNFHFMWKTRAACPVCQKEKAKKIIGECKDGSQLIHYQAPDNCINDGDVLAPDSRLCTLELRSLPFVLQILIPVVLGVCLLSLILVIYCWRKNRRLEVKYMKLATETNPGGNYEGELPGVDSCALEDGEDESYDSVSFKESKGIRFFKFGKNKQKKIDDIFSSDDDNPFELQSGEKTPLT